MGWNNELNQRVSSRLTSSNSQEINFLDDQSVTGYVYNAADVRARRRYRTPTELACFDGPLSNGQYGTVFRDLRRRMEDDEDIPETEYRQAMRQSQRQTIPCLHPCMNGSNLDGYMACLQDRTHEQSADCINAMANRARQTIPGFNDWKPNAQGQCPAPPPPAPPAPLWVQRIEEEVTRTHRCPENLRHLEEIDYLRMLTKSRRGRYGIRSPPPK